MLLFFKICLLAFAVLMLAVFCTAPRNANRYEYEDTDPKQNPNPYDFQ